MKYFILLLLIIPTQVYSNKTALSIPNVKTKPDTVYSELLKEIEKIKKENIENKKEINSLNEIVKTAKIKEEMYSNALNSQTAIFSVIVAAIIALIGLVTWTGYKIEIRKIKKEFNQLIENQESKFEEFVNHILNLEQDYSLTAAHTAVLIAVNTEKKESHNESYYYRLQAAYYHAMRANKLNLLKKENTDNIEISINVHLDKAYNTLNIAAAKYLDINSEVFNYIDTIAKEFKNEDIQQKCAKIRVKLYELRTNS